VLDHITDAEDIYETKLFLPSTGPDKKPDDGGGLRRIRTNVEWEQKMLVRPVAESTAGESQVLQEQKANVTETVAAFLSRWGVATLGSHPIPTQYLAYDRTPVPFYVRSFHTASQLDREMVSVRPYNSPSQSDISTCTNIDISRNRILEGGRPVGGQGPSNELGPLNISSGDFDELFASMRLAKPFFPCLWTTRGTYGLREFEYATCPAAVDIWYTVPLSVTVNGEGNFSLASSAIYSRYLPFSPQASFVLVVLRYNWEGSSLAGRPTKELERILGDYGVQPDMNFETRRVRNGCEWHLAPQVAYFAMVLVFWREGLEALDTFTHEQVRFSDVLFEMCTPCMHSLPLADFAMCLGTQDAPGARFGERASHSIQGELRSSAP